jgi:hypothetical protein
MTDQHSPITPPPELVAKWASSMCGYYEAARWGADQELEACCKWLEGEIGATDPEDLRIARRPKPPSLKEEATMALISLISGRFEYTEDKSVNAATIRRALEQLND